MIVFFSPSSNFSMKTFFSRWGPRSRFRENDAGSVANKRRALFIRHRLRVAHTHPRRALDDVPPEFIEHRLSAQGSAVRCRIFRRSVLPRSWLSGQNPFRGNNKQRTLPGRRVYNNSSRSTSAKRSALLPRKYRDVAHIGIKRFCVTTCDDVFEMNSCKICQIVSPYYNNL